MIEREMPELVNGDTRPYLRGEVQMPLPPERVTLCHADVKGEHLMVKADGSRLIGVIDWNDAFANDPAVDFGGILIWLGPAFVRLTLEHYEPPQPPEFFDRASHSRGQGPSVGSLRRSPA